MDDVHMGMYFLIVTLKGFDHNHISVGFDIACPRLEGDARA